MDDKKRDLIPVAAIALFLVIIIALCAVRLHQRRETRAEIAETESTQIWYSEEQAESAESETKDAADQTEETTAGKKQTAERGQQEDETLTEHPDSKLPAGKGKESQGAKQEGNLRTVSGNDPLSGAESANKTNEEMLLEMSGYWEQDNMDAVEDLAMLPWYMRMSSDISDANSFYYYGERSSYSHRAAAVRTDPAIECSLPRLPSFLPLPDCPDYPGFGSLTAHFHSCRIHRRSGRPPLSILSRTRRFFLGSGKGFHCR